MAKRIYVGGLAYATNEQDLQDLFAKSGSVNSVSVVTDKYTGQSKGFGFVDMENDNEAETAIRSLNGMTFAGRTLTVNEAKPREDRPRSNYGGGGGGGGGYRDNDRGGRW
jgi:RNA recognition motif-containing protein